MHLFLRLTFTIGFILIFGNKTYSQKKSKKKHPIYERASSGNFDRTDSIKGNITPLRSCYDVTFYHLDVEVNPRKKTIKGISYINFNVISTTQKIQIDLYEKLSIEKVSWNGLDLKFTRENSAVYVHFPDLLKKDNKEKIKVYYSGRPLDPNFDIPYYAGFVWDKDKRKNYYAQAICQGNGAHGWWPNKDHLSDEPDSSAVSITVPSKLKAISNGKLKKVTVLENGKTRYDWKTSYPINNYNITLNIGNYIRIKDEFEGVNKVALDYYVLPQDSAKAKIAFKIVKPMLEIYETHFGPYPFPKDGIKIIQAPYPMEHQSAIAIGNNFDMHLILHEVAHEWWGNSVSCTDMAELWIHEAFTTYAETLFLEKYYGIKRANAFMDTSRSIVMKKHPLMGSFNVNHVHYDLEDIYHEGQLMLHTLRNAINNDALWFDILKGIQREFKHKTVKTKDIVSYINNKTNTDYTSFFNEYLKYTDLPKLQLEVYKCKGKLALKYKWNTNETHFEIPVKLFLNKKESEFIYPTTIWKEMELPQNIDLSNVNIDINKFYVDVDYGNMISNLKSNIYTGVYVYKDNPSRHVKVTFENGKFIVQEDKNFRTSLVFKSSIHANVEYVKPKATIEFIKNDKGDISHFIVRQKGSITEWVKTE